VREEHHSTHRKNTMGCREANPQMQLHEVLRPDLNLGRISGRQVFSTLDQPCPCNGNMPVAFPFLAQRNNQENITR